jgi:hypothetical protein
VSTPENSQRIGLFGIEAKIAEMQQVPSLELTNLVSSAQTLLDEYGRETLIVSGEELPVDTNNDKFRETATTTQFCVEQEIAGTKYFIRPVRFIDGGSVFLALDETQPGNSVNVRSISLIKIGGDDESEAPNINVMGTINDIADVKSAATIIDLITKQEARKKQDDEAEKARRTREEERDQQIAERQRADEAARLLAQQREAERINAIPFYARGIRAVQRNSDIIISTALVGTVAVGAIWAAVKIAPRVKAKICGDSCEVSTYDKQDHRLNEGLIVRQGVTQTVPHTFEATQKTEFAESAVPELGEYTSGTSEDGYSIGFGPNVNGLRENRKANINNPRQIILVAPDDDKAKPPVCESVKVSLKTPNDAILVATDSSEKFARFMQIGLSDSILRACWNGPINELRQANNPRVVFQRATPKQIAELGTR